MTQLLAPAKSLDQALNSLPRDIYAVVDGAQFDDMRAELLRWGLLGRPLYRESDGDFGASGPHLVLAPDAQALENLRAMIADRPAAVFWSWRNGIDTLFRHLRTINLVEIPRDGSNANGAPAFETVVFRHPDPNVMASIVPLLDAAQMSRLLGAAGGLAVNAPDFGGAKLLLRPDGLPSMPRGYLRFATAQYDALGDAQLHKSRMTLMRSLRESASDLASDKDDRALFQTVVQAEKSGEQLGIRSEKGHFYWAFLYLITDGEAAKMPDVQKAFRESGADAEDTAEMLFDAFSEEVERL